ncbi:(d)CMP kinase [Neisseria sp. N95_16]|uniref:Cytidylate kinase n=1 Tax=Neisseria brasiliensis TaxID=2666100 RepID=A0A5Q3S3Q4_9NEIS|nr:MULTISPECIES: (d)CMP kinase [Neisseria]MRN39120.1 (d)CMP kinase [Neisseria brasiliensis]PJO10216.1 (d)CMP kinase [Neisseria sp. N95_16]PJO78590.1 (d)CMP kinase [Neisseria sp. N177_16]QGL25933.1 (d)CMP kinase [Neisseria brasiliensis]
MSEKQKVIAIDGPSASGKGTVASRVAAALGFDYLDSGALYRLTALYAQKENVEWTDEAGVAQLAERLPAEFDGQKVLLNGEDVSEQIRTEAIGMGASAVAQLPQVRTALLQRQRDFLTDKGLVADGRDIGSVIFPEAALKVFLTASAQVRAERRAKQIGLPCEGVEFDRILSDIEARDEADRRRAVAPLQQLPDAQLLDTTELGIEESVKKVLDWYSKV